VKEGIFMTPTESSENYLETILMLSEKKPVVRSVDVANETGFRKSSISIAMKNLRENGYITISPEGYISLTEKGLELASMIYERHKVLSAWFIHLGVDPKIAVEDACKIEHDLSAESFAAIKKYINENT
jgi:Mn-dependent DtxR family transcriptional regulator